MRALVWFRTDLRVADNRALDTALREADDVAALITLPLGQWREHEWGANKISFMLRAARALGDELSRLGIPLVIETSPTFTSAPDALTRAVKQQNADAVYFNLEYEINERRRDEATAAALRDIGADVRTFHDQTIIPPADIATKDGNAYKVYSPFRKAWEQAVERRADDAQPLPNPHRRPKTDPIHNDTSAIDAMLEDLDADASIESSWPADEKHASRRLKAFVSQRISDYADHRDMPAMNGTSTLSPYLAAGVISPRQCLDAARQANQGRLRGGRKGIDTWIGELAWREFYRHIVLHFPRVSMNQPFRPETRGIPWRESRDDFERWAAGQTGYPIVDAGMRQLQTRGWMHNRLRMITAMFLTKHLLLHWRWGERHFMQHLVDGDLANNNGGWQWSASTGTDAAPYFRIFNPTTQSKRFDPDGAFIRRYCPELADLDNHDIHEPARLPAIARSGIDYPEPICDHKHARDRALNAFKS